MEGKLEELERRIRDVEHQVKVERYARLDAQHDLFVAMMSVTDDDLFKMTTIELKAARDALLKKRKDKNARFWRTDIKTALDKIKQRLKRNGA